MPARLPQAVLVCLASLLAMGTLAAPAGAQTVWSGLTLQFEKPDGSDGSLPENQDQITDHVIFARGFTGGLYNAATEQFWNGAGPGDTEWATILMEGNQGLEQSDIAAANYANLEFTDWLTAYGGGGDMALHERIQNNRAVVHLLEDNIYLDIQFSFWAAGRFGGNGGFSYMRAEPPPPPVTTGDYNGNFVVDAADYTVWRNTLGQEVELGTGADGVADGTIDELDYDFWKERFGNVILMGSGSTAAAVPEPASCLLLLSGWSIIATTRKRSPRGPGQTF